MNPWLRYSLILTSIGGGFAGLSDVLQRIVAGGNDLPAISYVIMVILGGLFTFVIYAGFAIIRDPRDVKPMIVSLLIQLPAFSSFLIVYKFAVGLPLYLIFADGRFGLSGRFGCDYSFFLLRSARVGVGLNIFALAMLVWLIFSLVKDLSAPNQALERTAPAE